MRLILLFFGSLIFASASGQTGFPKTWEGDWKGDLYWFKTGHESPETVNMELRIHPATDTAGAWNWQIIYGRESEDNRPYLLIPRDTTGVHWVIDERNGIILDHYWVARQFSGVFTVMGNSILNNYKMENGKLVVEFYSFPAAPVTVSGKDTDESPKVDSYQVRSYQRAVLTKIH